MQKTRKLIERDKVDVIFGDVNSGIAYAMSQVTSEKKVFHIVPGGHTDPITGTDCKWNVFRICNTTSMDAAAITGGTGQALRQEVVLHHARLRLRPHVAGRLRQEPEGAGGEFEGDMLPITTTEFSATLIKAKAYKPNVLLNNMGGLAQINCMKQFVQFGMAKDMALGGALFELESIKSVPKEAQTGWWDMEWWWDQPNVPEVAKFVAAFSQGDRARSRRARHWFGYVAVHSVRLAAEKAKSLEGPKMAHGAGGSANCRPTSRCSPARSATAPATIS